VSLLRSPLQNVSLARFLALKVGEPARQTRDERSHSESDDCVQSLTQGHGLAIDVRTFGDHVAVPGCAALLKERSDLGRALLGGRDPLCESRVEILKVRESLKRLRTPFGIGNLFGKAAPLGLKYECAYACFVIHECQGGEDDPPVDQY
jgi:hypothetical protein